MENQYDVGIANRYALFLEEGENSLTAIKKKLSKETRQKNKAIKKENAEARKAEAAKALEKPKKPEPQPEAIEVPAPIKGSIRQKLLLSIFYFLYELENIHELLSRWYRVISSKFNGLNNRIDARTPALRTWKRSVTPNSSHSFYYLYLLVHWFSQFM